MIQESSKTTGFNDQGKGQENKLGFYKLNCIKQKKLKPRESYGLDQIEQNEEIILKHSDQDNFIKSGLKFPKQKSRTKSETDCNFYGHATKLENRRVFQNLKHITKNESSKASHSRRSSHNIPLLENFNQRHSYIPLNKISLNSNKMIFNLCNNYLVESQLLRNPEVFPTNVSGVSEPDSISVSTFNIKERISATKALFTKRQDSFSGSEASKPPQPLSEKKSIAKPTIKVEPPPEEFQEDFETSRTMLEIKEKIKKELEYSNYSK